MTLSQEDKLIDALEDCETATDFLQVSNKLIHLKLRTLLPNAFVQDETVMEYAVKPLLKENGPLMMTDVISKLLLAMGRISLESYADIGLYSQMLDYANNQSDKIGYDDEMVYDFINNLAVISNEHNRFYLDSINKIKFSSFESFSQVRYESLIKSATKLSCEQLIQTIEKELG